MNDLTAQYLRLLLSKNEILNLTAIRDPGEAALRHVEDALMAYDLFPLANKRVIDVGSGGGIPGIPLRLRDPSIQMTLLDATAKKVAFLREACDTLGLADVVCLSARAEDQSLMPNWRDSFDAAVARGVAFLPILCELCLPFVRPGGHFLAMKGSDVEEELAATGDIVKTLGARLVSATPYTLGESHRHTLVIFEKTHLTPIGYPRRYAKIKASYG